METAVFRGFYAHNQIFETSVCTQIALEGVENFIAFFTFKTPVLFFNSSRPILTLIFALVFMYYIRGLVFYA